MSPSSRSEFSDLIDLSEHRSQKCLRGLTIEETIEFELLDATAPFDDCGELAWDFEGQSKNDREKRWLALYNKSHHERG